MRKQMIMGVFKKEILDLLRDKKTMFMMVILPIILYPLLIIGSSQVYMLSMSTMAEKEQSIVLDFEIAPELKSILDSYEGEYGKLGIVESDNPQRDLEEDRISAYVTEVKQDNQVNYKIYMKEAKENSGNAAYSLKEVFKEYNRLLVEDKINSMGLDINTTLEPITSEKIDTSKGEEMAGYFLGMILPFMLIIGVLIGATYPASDVMAGEKERGTLETLLTLPLSNLELIMGKYLAVASMSIFTALLNILGLVLSLGYMIISMGGSNNDTFLSEIDLSKMFMPAFIAFIGLVLFALIITAISMSVCSLASSYKEAQSYISVIMIIGMVPAYVTMIPSFELNTFTAMIPISNVALLIKGVFTFQYDISSMAIVLVSNIAFVLISIWVLTKMFSSEDILFGSGGGLSFLNSRSQIVEGKMPTLGDGFAVYGITLLLFIYLGTYIQMKLGLVGVGLSQLLFLVIAVGTVVYTKAPVKEIFRIKTFNIKYVFSGLFIWMATFIASNLLSSLILYFFPQNLEALEEIGGLLFNEYPIYINLLIIAVLPAICEEIMFRGYLYSACSEKGHFSRGIVISSIMFGIMHLYLIKIIPTAMLGLAFSYIVYKSGSIFIAMLLHFINNSLAVLTIYYPDGFLEKIFYHVQINPHDFSTLKLLILIGTMITFMCLGILIANSDKSY